jgi:S-adenosylhomocysteine hydrolase
MRTRAVLIAAVALALVTTTAAWGDRPPPRPRLARLAPALHSTDAEPLMAGLVDRAPHGNGVLLGRLARKLEAMRAKGRLAEGEGGTAYEARRAAAHVVGELFAEATGRDGHLDLGLLGERGGIEAVAIAGALARLRVSDPLALRRMVFRAGPELLARFYATSPVTRPTMRALDHLVRQLGGGQPLRGIGVLGVQHLLGSTGGLLHALTASGVAADRIALVGKTYSEHPLVAREMRHDGFLILPGHARTDERQAMPRWLRAVQSLLPGLRDDRLEAALLERLRQPGRLLLLDDGGSLILLVNRLVTEHPELAGKIVAVEQTRRGIDKLSGVDLRFPVIDVARAWAKRTYEAPLIGRSVANSVEERLADLERRRIPFGKKVLVIGYGTVGRAVAREMKARGYDVVAYDKHDNARADAQEDGIPLYTTQAEAFPHGELVISSTGEIVVRKSNLGRLPTGAVLFNAGSHETEFDPALKDVPKTFRGVDVGHLDDWAQPSHGYAQLRAGRREYLLAAWGGVVNFGGVDPIPPRYIQLTRGLLYLGTLQAARATSPGIHALDEDPQHALVDRIQAELARRGESLSAPRF